MKKDGTINIPKKALFKSTCHVCKGTGDTGSYYFEEQCNKCYGVGWFWSISNKWIVHRKV